MNPWLQAGIGVTLGYVLWKFVLGGRVAEEAPALSGYAPNAYRRRGKKGKPWKKRTAMRVGERERMYKRAPSCFLKAGKKYPVCPKGGSKPTCDGLLSARRRAILNKDTATRAKAERKALKMKCGWAMRSKALVV
jgi:hypothetical protein